MLVPYFDVQMARLRLERKWRPRAGKLYLHKGSSKRAAMPVLAGYRHVATRLDLPVKTVRDVCESYMELAAQQLTTSSKRQFTCASAFEIKYHPRDQSLHIERPRKTWTAKFMPGNGMPHKKRRHGSYTYGGSSGSNGGN